MRKTLKVAWTKLSIYWRIILKIEEENNSCEHTSLLRNHSAHKSMSLIFLRLKHYHRRRLPCVSMDASHSTIYLHRPALLEFSSHSSLALWRIGVVSEGAFRKRAQGATRFSLHAEWSCWFKFCRRSLGTKWNRGRFKLKSRCCINFTHPPLTQDNPRWTRDPLFIVTALPLLTF